MTIDDITVDKPPRKKRVGNNNNGGARKGAGRPKGSVQKLTAQAREEAKATGLLPHEWLLKVSRGEPIEQSHWKETHNAKGEVTSKVLVTGMVYPDIVMRIDAAKAAAPYYAPKLATQIISVNSGGPEGIAEQLRYLADKLPV